MVIRIAAFIDRLFSMPVFCTLLALAFSALEVTPAKAADVNLVGYWALDDGSGATAADSSGYGHPGALTGGSWSASPAPTAFANTGSLSLDGSSGQGINATQISSATNNLSLSGWANWAGANALGQMLIYNGDSGPNGYGIYLQPNGELSILNGGVALASSSTSFKLTVGVWQYVVAMRDAGVWKLYVDGIQVALNANPVPNPPSGQTSIGRGTVTAGTTFNGLIDDVRVYDRVLTASELCSPAITVTNANDSGAGSLRQAIAGLCSGGTITFDNDYTILLASELVINKNLTITGAGHSVTISGNHVTRVLNLTGGTISLNKLTIADGYLVDGSYSGISGAGIYVNGATLNVSNSTFSGNMTGWPGGGGIELWVGTANVSNSTFSGNSGNYGGGIDSFRDTTLNVTNCTFTGNSAASAGGGLSVGGTGNIINSTISGNSSGWDGGGGGINSEDGTVTITNSIITNNPTGNNCWSHYGGLFYGANNLANDATCGAGFTNSASILLGALGNYDGSTQTFPLLPGSAAIDAGDSAICAAAPVSSLDQRGVARPAACDIGACESQGFTIAKTGGDSQSATINTAFADPLAVSVTSAFGEPVDGGKVTFTPPGSGASAAITTSPATIASGAASVTATANATAGGPYTVTASAAGATGVNFSLTNLDPTTTTTSVEPTTTTTSVEPTTSSTTTSLEPTTTTTTIACAASITVTSNGDSGAGSLRQAIADACAGSTITFDAGLAGQTITLSSPLTIDKNLTIDGGADNITVSGNNALRIFYINNGVTALLKNLTIANGKMTGIGLLGYGGGIFNDGNLTITNSTLADNNATNGGAIFNNAGGTLTVTNSTFSNNSATGGGIYINAGALVTITNSTFSGNGGSAAGGIVNWSATTTFKNTIIANSVAVENCYSFGVAFAAGSANNLSDDATCGASFTNSASILLGALGNYGGSTQTFPLLPSSAAIDAGDNATCAATDQRGVARPQGSACDIGAFESQGFTLAKTGGDSQSATVNTAFAQPFALSVTSAYGEPVDGGQVAFTPPDSGPSAVIAGSPATIGSDGMVSVTATANSTAGGPYNVTASAAGAAGVNFSLTNSAFISTTTTVETTTSTTTIESTTTTTTIATTTSTTTVVPTTTTTTVSEQTTTTTTTVIDNSTCELTIYPAQFTKLLLDTPESRNLARQDVDPPFTPEALIALIKILRVTVPLQSFVFVGSPDTVFGFNETPVWSPETIKTFIKFRLARRVMFALVFINPLIAEAGTYEVTIGDCTGKVELLEP